MGIIIVLLFPTLLMLLASVLLFVRSLHNLFIECVYFLAYFGGVLYIFWAIYSVERGSTPWLSALIMALIVLAANAWQFKYALRLLGTKRCPNCHSMSGNVFSKKVTQTTSASIKTWKEEGRSGRFGEKNEHVHTETRYISVCDKCSHQFEYNEEDEEDFTSGKRKL